MKVLRVACHKCKSVHKCRSSNHGIHGTYGASPRLLARHNSAPFITDWSINQDDPLFKPPWEFPLQPLIKLAAAPSLWQPLDPVTQLSNSHDT